MISGFKRIVGLITVREQNDKVVIEGIPGNDLARDIAAYWSTSRINLHMFNVFTRNKLVFGKFFAVDVLYMMQTLHDSKATRTPRRFLQKIIQELLVNTWLKDINDPSRHTLLNFSKRDAVRFKLLPHQEEFLERYNKVVPSYRLKGMLLAAPPGSGKTITDLVLGACLEADITIIVSPKNAIERVWEAELQNNMTVTPEYWISKTDEQAPLGKTHYVFHYEALDRAINLAGRLPRGKKVYIALDECHNFNTPDSLRTGLFVDLCFMTRCQNVLWASGTPIKAIGAECIPMLRTIDPYFTKDAEERFRKIFGRDARRANDILCNRIGLITFKVEKATVVNVKVVAEPLTVTIDNAADYTLDSIRDEMRNFMDDRMKHYTANMREYQDLYTRCVALHAEKLTSAAERQELATYKRYVDLIRKGYDPVAMKAEVIFCNKYELRYILPSLPDNLRKPFKSVRSIIKYVKLKVMGEALGGVLGRKRVQCHLDMVKAMPLAKLIDDAKKKTIIFTSYVEVVDAVYDRLKAEGYEPIRVYGDTNNQLRSLIERFDKDENLNPAIATYQSLSTAVPMTMANNIININSPFRDHEREQSIARCARLGQDEDVTVWDMFLDTGNKPNISTRSKDILEWSKAQVEAIMGVQTPADLETSLEDMLNSTVPLEVSQETFVQEIHRIYDELIRDQK